MTETSDKTVRDVLKAGEAYLAGKRVEEPGIACELLVSRLLNCRRLELCLHFGEPLSELRLEAMRRGIKRVADGEPVQYVLGQVEFMGSVFKVDRRALIPRPETELLVEQALRCEALWQRTTPGIIDVGSGSGCIIISLAKARAGARYVGLDISAEALSLARENAAALGVGDRIAFAHAELSDIAEPESIDAVVSNPPYVRTSECETLPGHIRCHEPRMALDGGPRGLTAIETVIEDAAIALKPGGFLFMEIGHDQGPAVRSLLAQSGFADVRLHKDLGGHDRIVVAVQAVSEPNGGPAICRTQA